MLESDTQTPRHDRRFFKGACVHQPAQKNIFHIFHAVSFDVLRNHVCGRR